MKLSSLWSSKLALPAVAILGLVVFVLAKQGAKAPQQNQAEEYAVPVSLTALSSETIRPSVSGYGVVKAAVELQQIAEVSARVVAINPDLVAGATLSKDTLLITLDDQDYRLALAQSLAQLENLKAQQQELASNHNSLKKQRQLVSDKISLAQQELERKQNLARVQSLSASQLEAEQQKLIALQQEAASLDQQLQALPAKQQSLQAQLESARAAADQQQRNIERTRITMPFDGRIRSLDVEKNEFINQGQLLFQAIGIDQVEIEAQFSLDKLRPFIELAFAGSLNNDLSNSGNTGLNARGQNISEFLRNSGLSAEISLPMAPGQTWQGEVVTLRETLDPDSYTLGAVIRVDKHYENLIPGKRPPLLAGLQVKAELLAAENQFVTVPLHTLHAGNDGQQWLYLAQPLANTDETAAEVEAEETRQQHYRLIKQSVKPAIISANQALFSPQQFARFQQQGLQLINNDITPAVNGMLLQAVE